MCSSIGVGSDRLCIRLCTFTRLLSSPIWVVICSSLTITLADVLGCLGTVDFISMALLTAFLPHLHSCLQPSVLIGCDVFFFRKMGTFCCCEHKGVELGSH